MITGIRHFGIQISCKQKFYESLTFYKLLGLKEIYHQYEDWGTIFGFIKVIKLSCNDISIELIYRPNLPNLDAMHYFGCHVAFTVNNLKKICQIIDDEHYSIVVKPILSPDASVRVAFCYDPNGILVELVEELK